MELEFGKQWQLWKTFISKKDTIVFKCVTFGSNKGKIKLVITTSIILEFLSLGAQLKEIFYRKLTLKNFLPMLQKASLSRRDKYTVINKKI